MRRLIVSSEAVYRYGVSHHPVITVQEAIVTNRVSQLFPL